MDATSERIDLQPFCHRGDNWPALTQPWQANHAEAAATDGSILILAESDRVLPFESIDGRRPDIQKTVGPISSVTQWRDLPPPTDPCDKCGDEGTFTEECSNCDGSGDCSCDCGDKHDCGRCDGEGSHVVLCDCCVILDKRRIQRRYVNLLRQLPECQYGTTVNGKTKPVYFRFAGGYGAVMPKVEKR